MSFFCFSLSLSEDNSQYYVINLSQYSWPPGLVVSGLLASWLNLLLTLGAFVGSSITKNKWSWPTHSTGWQWGLRAGDTWATSIMRLSWCADVCLGLWGGWRGPDLWLTTCLPGIQTPWASLGTRCSTALSTVSPPASLPLPRVISPSSWVARLGLARALLDVSRPPLAWLRPQRQPPQLPPRPRPLGRPRRSQGRPQRLRLALPVKTWRWLSWKACYVPAATRLSPKYLQVSSGLAYHLSS